jgi:hypothetical protein
LTSNESSGIVKLLVSFNDDDDYKGKDFIQGTGQSQCFFSSKYISDSFNTKIYFQNE